MSSLFNKICFSIQTDDFADRDASISCQQNEREIHAKGNEQKILLRRTSANSSKCCYQELSEQSTSSDTVSVVRSATKSNVEYMIKERKENAIEKSDKYINEFDVFLFIFSSFAQESVSMISTKFLLIIRMIELCRSGNNRCFLLQPYKRALIEQ